MTNPQDLVDKFVKPWLEENHPNAAIVFLAGSQGRALREGNYKPTKSSDIDLVIVYKDLEQGGFKVATQVFVQEDVGTKLGEGAPRMMMVDTNIHDFTSLIYHDKFVREHMSIPFISVMIDEGYIVKDTTGVAPLMQAEAAKFLKAGPAPRSKAEWQADIDLLKGYLDDLKSAQSIEERRFIGTLLLPHVSDIALRVHGLWPGGINNQAYRSLSKNLPYWCGKISEGFSDLMRHGDIEGAEMMALLCLGNARLIMERSPDEKQPMPYAVDKHVPADEVKQMRHVFQKFMTEHVTGALDTSGLRGELSYLQTVAAVVYNIKASIALRDGDAPTEGRAAMDYLANKAPDLLPVVLQALDEGLHEPLAKIADNALSHMEGIHYSRIQNHYIEDLARVYATDPDLKKSSSKPWLKPGYKP